jgi:oligopeptide/dipeptide ABC transporter ATP-binding protein
MSTSESAAPVLELRALRTCFRGPGGVALPAVDGVSFAVPPRTTVGIVGESGCGKSATALSILRLHPEGTTISGQVLYKPQAGPAVDLMGLGPAALRAVRGDRIAMIFQEPMTALNPVYTVGDQVAEPLRAHRSMPRREALARAAELLRQVGIPDPVRRCASYPHQLSGGMRQRVMIAMALSCGPDLLIADEPTTALDVTIQAQILDLLRSLQEQLGMSVLLITHDLGVIAQMCALVVVMYAGQVVEQAPAGALFRAPRHPYTAGLLRSVPRLSGKGGGPRTRLQEIPGLVPRLADLPAGCRFQDRCPAARPRCKAEAPALQAVEDGRLVRCHFPLGGGALAAEGAPA